MADMPIEIKELSPALEEPRVYILENVGDREFLSLGKRGVVVRVETKPGLGRDIGVIEFDTRELDAIRNDGTKMIHAPFSTKPGDKIVVTKKGGTKHFEIRHLDQ